MSQSRQQATGKAVAKTGPPVLRDGSGSASAAVGSLLAQLRVAQAKPPPPAPPKASTTAPTTLAVVTPMAKSHPFALPAVGTMRVEEHYAVGLLPARVTMAKPSLPLPPPVPVVVHAKHKAKAHAKHKAKATAAQVRAARGGHWGRAMLRVHTLIAKAKAQSKVAAMVKAKAKAKVAAKAKMNAAHAKVKAATRAFAKAERYYDTFLHPFPPDALPPRPYAPMPLSELVACVKRDVRCFGPDSARRLTTHEIKQVLYHFFDAIATSMRQGYTIRVPKQFALVPHRRNRTIEAVTTRRFRCYIFDNYL